MGTGAGRAAVAFGESVACETVAAWGTGPVFAGPESPDLGGMFDVAGMFDPDPVLGADPLAAAGVSAVAAVRRTAAVAGPGAAPDRTAGEPGRGPGLSVVPAGRPGSRYAGGRWAPADLAGRMSWAGPIAANEPSSGPGNAAAARRSGEKPLLRNANDWPGR